MKTLNFTLGLLLMGYCLLIYAGGEGKRSWNLQFEQDGVEFYTSSMMEHVAENAKTLVKIKVP